MACRRMARTSAAVQLAVHCQSYAVPVLPAKLSVADGPATIWRDTLEFAQCNELSAWLGLLAAQLVRGFQP